LNRDGAVALAKRLEKYWRYPAARFWTEPLDERFAKIGTYEVYQVEVQSRERIATALSRRERLGLQHHAAFAEAKNQLAVRSSCERWEIANDPGKNADG
jgi:hypothetical protein